MGNRTRTALDVVIPGVIAGTLFSLAAALRGRADSGSAIAPLNAPSHVLWGEEAVAAERFALRYTLPGALLNLGAGVFWAALMRAIFGPGSRCRLSGLLAAGAAVSALAWSVDYHLLPDRLSPGIQRRISCRSLLTVHGIFALGLALGSWLTCEPDGLGPANVHRSIRLPQKRR